MRAFTVPVAKYIIHTQLGKAPQDYPNSNSMPSVQVALKQMAKGKHVKAKDVMSFVITGSSGGSAEQAAKNAFPTDEVLKPDGGLKPDIEYYLHKQILPPVERLCAPISGTNVTMLADCLGLDTSKYRVSSGGGGGEVSNDAEIQPLESQIPDTVRFKDTSPLRLRCRVCQTYSQFRGLVPLIDSTTTDEKDKDTVVTHDGLTCPCGKLIPNISIVAQLESQIRHHISTFYANHLLCTDPSCSQHSTPTRQLSVYGTRCLGPQSLALGCKGTMHQQYTEKALYNQLLFFGRCFDESDVRAKAEKECREGRMGVERKEKVGVLVAVNEERWRTLGGGW